MYVFLRRLQARSRPFLAGVEVRHEYEAFRSGEPWRDLDAAELDELVERTQEVVVRDTVLYLAIRERVARWRYVRVSADDLGCSDVTVADFLDVKERLVTGEGGADRSVVEVDLEPFERGFPRLTQARSIGRGVERLNRYLSVGLFEERRTRFDPTGERSGRNGTARFGADEDAWMEIARAGVERVAERYNWPLYASRLLELSRIYGFWKYISSLDRDEPRRYLEMFYGLMYRPLAEHVETPDRARLEAPWPLATLT